MGHGVLDLPTPRQAPFASSRLSPMIPGLACLSTIPTAPATATTMTLTWDPTAVVALVVSTVTAGTQPVSGAPSMASCGAAARAASRTGATPARLCAVTPSCHRQPPRSLFLLGGQRWTPWGGGAWQAPAVPLLPVHGPWPWHDGHAGAGG